MKSGGITRGLQAGNTQDLTFTNSFNLTFSGNLGEELAFKGAVSEESTPLQPEGNTQTLREIDRIYLEMIAGKVFQALLGDYTLDLHPRRMSSMNGDIGLKPIYNEFSRKVLGVRTDLQVGPTELILSGSATKGKFTTLAIQGSDAVQGPYRLEGKNGERAIVVIAGTERVYIDGVQLLRGELNDYVIDYGLAEIRFTNKRIITSSTRITVDFEYTDEQYSRTLAAGSQNSLFFDNRLQFSTSYIREGEDQNSPLNLSLSDSDKMILASAGPDPRKAGKSGVITTGRDSLGRARGNYLRQDTVLSGLRVLFYKYAPYDTTNAIYNVAFGYAGNLKGSYVRNALGEYSFVGPGLGNYDTTIFLPLPQLTQLVSAQLSFFPFRTLAFTTELARSDLEPNRFAPNYSVQDNAYHLYGSFQDTIGTSAIEANYSERYKGGNFSPIDRDRKVEELRDYGIDAPIETYSFSSNSERERKAKMQYGIGAGSLALNYASYTRGVDIYQAERFAGALSLNEDTGYIPKVIVTDSRTNTTDLSDTLRSQWELYSATAKKTYKLPTFQLTPGLQASMESRASNTLSKSDSLTAQSFRFRQITPSLDVYLSPHVNLGGSIQLRNDDSSRLGLFKQVSTAATYQFTSSLINLSGFSTQIDLGYLNKEYHDSLSRTLNGGNISSLLVRLIPRYQSSNSFLNIDGIYEASEQRAARLERVFFPVQKGLGNYKYLGDLNRNGKQDPDEFAPAAYADEGAFILLTLPTEALFPVTDLRSSLHVRMNPLPYLGVETSIRIEESSNDPNSSDIYLFRLSHFLNETSTIRGLIETQQDLSVLDNNPAQSYRLRWIERKNAVQYNTGLERLYYREYSLRGRFRPTVEIGDETVVSLIQDNAQSGEHSTTYPHATTRLDMHSELTYEPFASALGFGSKVGYSIASDNSFHPELQATMSTVSINCRYSVSGTTRLRAELGRDELIVRNAASIIAIPYSVSQGKSLGSTWLWTVSLDVQIASGIVLTAGYSGRSELTDGLNRSVIHNARAEARASF
ncbi:MAG: hypothetical protein Q8896_09680 [Bacteroidota bacterium]|nr:hypothetical protein [Bacteroidota bacterium]